MKGDDGLDFDDEPPHRQHRHRHYPRSIQGSAPQLLPFNGRPSKVRVTVVP